MNMHYVCFVCGDKSLREPPYNKGGGASHEICRCCGFQYGFDDDCELEHLDRESAHKVYRKEWLNHGAKVFDLDDYAKRHVDKTTGCVKRDHLIRQLARIGVSIEEE